jgi:hypothetical protein
MNKEEIIKLLKDIKLYNPQDLRMISNGNGEFPDGYVLTEEGIEKIIKHITNE